MEICKDIFVFSASRKSKQLRRFVMQPIGPSPCAESASGAGGCRGNRTQSTGGRGHKMPKKSATTTGKEAVVVPFDDGDAIRRLDALDNGIGFLVRTTHRLFWRVLDRRLAEYGITPEMWTYLRVIWHDEGLSLRQIAERLNLEGPTVGTAIKIMEKRGLVTRKRNRDDGREWRIYLRPRGRALKQILLPIAERTNADAKAGLSASQVEVLKSGLFQMQANLRRLATELDERADNEMIRARTTQGRRLSEVAP
jgi:DNA-binding MarR family transcriptional regulator